MPHQQDHRPAQRLTRSQRWLALILPVAGVWLALSVAARNPDGGRDWPSFIAMGTVGTLVWLGVWIGTMKVLANKAQQSRSTEDRLAETGSRAKLIYGASPSPEPDGAGQGPETDEAVEDGSTAPEEDG